MRGLGFEVRDSGFEVRVWLCQMEKHTDDADNQLRISNYEVLMAKYHYRSYARGGHCGFQSALPVKKTECEMAKHLCQQSTISYKQSISRPQPLLGSFGVYRTNTVCMLNNPVILNVVKYLLIGCRICLCVFKCRDSEKE